MPPPATLEGLWDSALPATDSFSPDRFSHLPEPALRYLTHAIAPGTPLASAVRLRMRGEIKLKGWLPFRAEQVIRRDGAMVWQASVRMGGLPVRGFDRLVSGQGEMRWRIFGLIPVMTAAGPDITRSAAGRVAAESMWLPSLLCGDEVAWSSPGTDRAVAHLMVAGETVDLTLDVDAQGGLLGSSLRRWGNPDGGPHRYHDFGGRVEEERTFGGFTIPTRVRAGWYVGSPRFESEGEFFRATVESAELR
jgi:hypothetical protein